jgi:hypothetical protein
LSYVVVLTVVVLTHQRRATVHMAMLKITDEMRAAARKLLQAPALKFNVPDRNLLTAISDGKRKLINAHWWTKQFRVVGQKKLAKLQMLADPAHNPMEHERAVAARKIREFKDGRAPGLRPQPPPLPSRIELWERKLKRRKGRPAPQTPPRRGLPMPDGGVNKGAATDRGGVNKKATTGRGAGGSGGVNTKSKRTGDRHLNKGDRHRPGYMRDYMRRRRAKLRP